jgi:dihydroxyacetone kinase-like predicted kinase
MDVVKIVVENGEVVESDSVADIDEKMNSLNLIQSPSKPGDSTSENELIRVQSYAESMRFFRVTEGTRLVLSDGDAVKKPPTVKAPNLDDVGGLDNQKALLLRLMNLMLNHQNEQLTEYYGKRTYRYMKVTR